MAHKVSEAELHQPVRAWFHHWNKIADQAFQMPAEDDPAEVHRSLDDDEARSAPRWRNRASSASPVTSSRSRRPDPSAVSAAYRFFTSDRGMGMFAEAVLQRSSADISVSYVGNPGRTDTICLSIPNSPGAKPNARPTSCGKWMIGI